MEAERTVLFADVCDSTEIAEALGNVASRSIISEILGKLRAATESMGGTVIKTIGDEIMCSFTSPMDGIAAAVDMQRAVSAMLPVNGIHSRVRIGLHSGTVLLEGGDLFGDVVNVSARVVNMAAGEQVLTTGTTIGKIADGLVPYRPLLRPLLDPSPSVTQRRGSSLRPRPARSCAARRRMSHSASRTVGRPPTDGSTRRPWSAARAGRWYLSRRRFP